ncbi:MAG: polysaccharide biosynthesis tyrosine autokinase, partial [Proteobacteria bacterium]|nr:polysaccharide biosynthesis tyrosine autokinase [Pseudomonadota bacterium]
MFNNNQTPNAANYNPALNQNNLPQRISDGGGYQNFNQEVNYNLASDIGVANSGDISFAEFLKMLNDRKVIIGMVTAVCFAFAVLYSLWLPNRYTANTTLEISGYAPVLAGASSENLYGQDTRKQDYQRTTIAKLENLGIVDEVLAKDDLFKELNTYFSNRRSFLGKLLSSLSFRKKNTDAENDAPTSRYTFKEDFIKKYLGLVKIDPITNTSLVKVSVTTTDPKLSERIANAHSEGFIEHLRKERQDSMLANLKLLQSKADELQGKVVASEQKIAQFAKSHKLITLTKDENLSIKQISDLTGLLSTATEKRIKSESLLSELEKDTQGNSLALDDEAIAKFRVSLAEAEAEYATMGEKLKPNFPSMLSLKAKIDSLQGAIKNQRNQAIRALRRQYESDLNSEQKLLKEIEIERNKAYETSQYSVEYNILQREYDSLKELYQNVLRQLQELMISSAGTVSNIYVSDYAAIPQTTSGPYRGLIMTLGLGLGLLFGVITAVMLHLFDNTIKSSDDMQSLLRLPVLGIVPSFSILMNSGDKKLEAASVETNLAKSIEKSNGKIEQLPLKRLANSEFVTVAHPNAVVSEAYRTIRVGILLSSADRPSKVVMVSSAKKGEGKSSFISNLAITFAQASYRTLIIDTDIRQAKLNKLFNVPENQHGLVDYLTRQGKIENIIHKTSINNLSILPAGSLAPNPAELLGSKKMAELIETLKGQYDYILVDAAPVLPVADSLILSRLVDGVILMVRENETERSFAQEAKKRLSQVGAKLLGVVINDAVLN